MLETLKYVVPVEVRSASTDDGPHLCATIIQEGRAGSVRSELFAPMSIIWPENGVAVRVEHRGIEVARAVPERRQDGDNNNPHTRNGADSGSVHNQAIHEHRIYEPG